MNALIRLAILGLCLLALLLVGLTTAPKAGERDQLHLSDPIQEVTAQQRGFAGVLGQSAAVTYPPSCDLGEFLAASREWAKLERTATAWRRMREPRVDRAESRWRAAVAACTEGK